MRASLRWLRHSAAGMRPRNLVTSLRLRGPATGNFDAAIIVESDRPRGRHLDEPGGALAPIAPSTPTGAYP
jgi:hypothetical protein